MPQALHIFRKDIRKFWPEILVSIAIAAVFVWIYPYQWLVILPPESHSFLDLRRLQILATVVAGLLPITWAILITRVVHAENLIGDRQFWITRPYDRRHLLCAKLLFLAAFVYVPFLVAQMALLDGYVERNRASLHPQLAHFLERRSYTKALLFLGGDSDIPAGSCGGRP